MAAPGHKLKDAEMIGGGGCEKETRNYKPQTENFCSKGSGGRVVPKEDNKPSKRRGDNPKE